MILSGVCMAFFWIYVFDNEHGYIALYCMIGAWVVYDVIFLWKEDFDFKVV